MKQANSSKQDKPTLVFDLGNVLVKFSLDPFFQFLGDHGAEKTTLQKKAPDLFYRYERGKITSKDFTNKLRTWCKRPVEQEALIYEWQQIFTPDPAMLQLARELVEKFPNALLSNTNELHWDYLNREYQLEQIFDKVVLSYVVGSMKPDSKIYQILEEKTQCCANQLLFIDDRPENIEAAEKRGWRGVQHHTASNTRAELAKL